MKRFEPKNEVERSRNLLHYYYYYYYMTDIKYTCQILLTVWLTD